MAGADRESRAGDARALTRRQGDAEVGQDRVVIGVEEDVSRRDVAVHVAALVGVAKGVGDAQQHALEFGLGQAALHPRSEVAAGEVLHGEIVLLRTRHAHVEHLHDVRMGERGEHACFLQEAARERGIGRQRRGHDLERNLAVQRGLQSQVHAGHATVADLVSDHIAGNLDHAGPRPHRCRMPAHSSGRCAAAIRAAAHGADPGLSSRAAATTLAR